MTFRLPCLSAKSTYPWGACLCCPVGLGESHRGTDGGQRREAKTKWETPGWTLEAIQDRRPFPLSSPIPRAPQGQPSPEPTSTLSSRPLLKTHDGRGWREVTTARPQPVTTLSQVTALSICRPPALVQSGTAGDAGSPEMGVGTAPQEETELKALEERNRHPPHARSDQTPG